MTLLKVLQRLFVYFDGSLQLFYIFRSTFPEGSLGLSVPLFPFFGSCVYLQGKEVSLMERSICNLNQNAADVGQNDLQAYVRLFFSAAAVVQGCVGGGLVHGGHRLVQVWKQENSATSHQQPSCLPPCRLLVNPFPSWLYPLLQVPTPSVPLLEAEVVDAKTGETRHQQMQATTAGTSAVIFNVSDYWDGLDGVICWIKC